MYSKKGVLKNKIAMKGWTNIEFAKKVGISKNYLSSIVNSKTSLSPKRAKIISDILDCPIDELFEMRVMEK